MTRADLKAIISRWVPDATDPQQNAAIQEALAALQKELGIGEEVSEDIAVAAGAASASVTGQFYTIEAVIWNPTSDYSMLRSVPYSQLVTELRGKNQNQRGTPTYYASTGSSVYLWEIPSQSGTLRVVGLGPFVDAHDLDDDADTVHPAISEPSIVAYKAIIDMLLDRRQAVTVFKEVLPVFRTKMRLMQAALKGVQGQVSAPDVTPARYDWSEY